MFVKIWRKDSVENQLKNDNNIENEKRDNLVDKFEFIKQIEFNESVTSVEFVKSLIIVGLENGDIFFYKVVDKISDMEIEILGKLTQNLSFGGKVNRIKAKLTNDKVLLGCCGDDNSVRIYSINKNLL